jgi:hypothetical protein
MEQLASDDIVLVGGQAVMFWAHYYGIIEEVASLTGDIDYFGQRADVEDADQKLANFTHETHLADWDDSSPNSGLILVEVPGHQGKVRIDFLWGVQGLSGADMRERAVRASIPGVSKPIQVLHPLMCLESKISNLGSLPAKRTPESIEQARLSVSVVRLLLEHMLADKRERDVLKLVERVASVATSDSSHYSFAVCGVDVLQAIPVNNFSSLEFKTIRWLQMQNQVADRRRRFSALLPPEPSPQNTGHMRFRT